MKENKAEFYKEGKKYCTRWKDKNECPEISRCFQEEKPLTKQKQIQLRELRLPPNPAMKAYIKLYSFFAPRDLELISNITPRLIWNTVYKDI